MTLPKHYLRSKCHVVLLYTCTCNFTYILMKVQPFLHQYSQNSHMLNSITRKSLMQNFTKTGQRMGKVWIQICLCPSVKYGIHCTNFHEIYSNSKNFCGHILHWISPKSKKEENRGKISFMPLIMIFNKLVFTKLNPARQLSANNAYTKFHENLANSLVAVISSQTNRRIDGQTDSWMDMTSFSFLLHKEQLKMEGGMA
jgi:hypothetical protein